MTTLRDLLNQIDAETPAALITDGATDWTANNLIDALDEERLESEAAYNEFGHICYVNEAGYLESPATFEIVAQSGEESA